MLQMNMRYRSAVAGFCGFSLWGTEVLRVSARRCQPSQQCAHAFCFWQKHGLELNLATERAKIWVQQLLI